jgi:hypothetical protein
LVIASFYIAAKVHDCHVFLRCKLHSKKNKVDNIPQRKPIINASQEKVATVLSNCFHAEDFRDEIKPLCNSMLGGTMNSFKTRILNFVVNNRMYQGMFYYNNIQKVLPKK